MKLSSNKGSATNSSTKKKSSSLFQRGYDPARAEKHRQDEAREQSSKRLYNLFLKEDGDEATVRFLTEEPVNFYAHNIKTTRGGKEFYEMVACSQDDNCEICEDGDKPSYKGAYLVYDRRTFEKKDKNGKTYLNAKLSEELKKSDSAPVGTPSRPVIDDDLPF